MRLARVAAAGVVLALLHAAPAYAADEVGLSLTGRNWSGSLDADLFAAPHRWVPGDVETRRFFVRNQGPTAATMTLAVDGGDLDGLLAHRDVVLRARVAGQPWQELAAAADRPLSTELLPAAGIRRVEVEARFLASSTDRSETRRLPLHFVVTLADGAAAPSAPDRGHDLPSTGSKVDTWTLAAAAALIATGLLLVAGRRKENDVE